MDTNITNILLDIVEQIKSISVELNTGLAPNFWLKMSVWCTGGAAIATAIAAIATSIAAYLTKKTLKEIQEQKESSYTPNIMISCGKYATNSNTYKDENYLKSIYSIYKQSKGFSIINNGFGAAKYININFIYEHKTVSEHITSLYNENEHIRNMLSTVKHNTVKDVDILRASEDKEVKIPFSYFLLTHLAYNLIYINNIDMNIPKSKMIISYFDMLNKKRESYFILTPKIEEQKVIGHSQNNSTETIERYIKFVAIECDNNFYPFTNEAPPTPAT